MLFLFFFSFVFCFFVVLFLHMQRTSVYLWATSLITLNFFNTSKMDKCFTKHNNPQSHKTPTLDEEIHSIWIHGSILLDPFIAHDRKKLFRCECFHNSLTLWPMHMPPNATSCFAFESGLSETCVWYLTRLKWSSLFVDGVWSISWFLWWYHAVCGNVSLSFSSKGLFWFFWCEWITGELTK